MLIIGEVDGHVVGNLNFTGDLKQRNSNVGEFGVSVFKEYWGKGIGKEHIKYLINWSKNSGVIRKINLRVRNDNSRGIYLYRILGFLEEGVIKKDFFINGLIN